MAHIIDPEEAKAILAQQRATSDPYLKDDGVKGVVARSIDIHEVMTLWRISETNRKSDPDDIMTAIFNLFVGAVAAEIETNVIPERMNEAIAKLTVEFQQRVQRALLMISKAPSIEAKEVGTA